MEQYYLLVRIDHPRKSLLNDVLFKIIFYTTGPDGISDFKTHVEEQFCVGHGSMSPEASSDTKYLCRAATVSEHQYFIVEPPLSGLEIFYSRLISRYRIVPIHLQRRPGWER